MSITHKPYRGFIKLIIGPMFSGKTTELLNEYDRYIIASRKCLLVKHSIDTRNTFIRTHSNIENRDCISCMYLKSINHLIVDYNAIFIDEIQFFDDAVMYCENWANKGLIIIAAGLSGTYKRTPFPIISELISKAEKIIIKDAICKETGKTANFTMKINNSGNIIDIGSEDKYKPVDRQTYMKLIEKS